MADVYMHSRLTEELQKELKSDIDLDIAFLGSQGPDPLYYSGIKGSRPIADDIHRYRTRDFFKTMIEYVKQNNNKETYSFLYGFISHYVMDIYIHPYVYYNTGVYDPNNPDTYSLRGLHLRFERTVDCLLIEKETNQHPRKMNLTKKYFPLKEAPIEVLHLMHHTLEKEYKISNGYSMFENSVKAMFKTLKYLVTDRIGIKTLILKFVDLFNRKNDLLLGDLPLFKNTKKYDYHNDLKNTWQHPLTGEKTNKTIEELFQDAKEYAKDILINVEDYLFKGKDINLDNIFTDLSFNTGQPCELGMNFKYIKIYNQKATS